MSNEDILVLNVKKAGEYLIKHAEEIVGDKTNTEEVDIRLDINRLFTKINIDKTYNI